jgi:hypothetical protein
MWVWILTMSLTASDEENNPLNLVSFSFLYCKIRIG